MVTQHLLEKHGVGPGTNYVVEKMNQVKENLLFILTNKERKKEFTFMHRYSYIELKKIILQPSFTWSMPNEWSSKLIEQRLYLLITCTSNRGNSVSQQYSIMAYNHPAYFQPVFTINNPINISSDFWDKTPTVNDYPIKISIELMGKASKFDFDVQIVYDALMD